MATVCRSPKTFFLNLGISIPNQNLLSSVAKNQKKKVGFLQTVASPFILEINNFVEEKKLTGMPKKIYTVKKKIPST
jgi:hypothetical protein